jgi:DNA-directed RNA polymerase subunit RPC12/RpoP
MTDTLTPKDPPAGRKFPCARCGARLDFDPGARALHCPYCGHVQTIDPSDRAVREHDFRAEAVGAAEAPLPGRSSEVRCGGCGAVVLLEDKVATDHCPYCGTHLENQPQAAAAMIPPEALLPFAVGQRQAVEAFARWLGSLWFAPGGLRRLADLGRLRGVYVPFWTFDAMTYTHYTGERGDDYQETENYTERDAQGNLVNKQRTVTKTRWWPVSGEVRHFFDDVLVCASRGLPPGYAGAVATAELRHLEPFRPEFLSGFQTERYTIGPREGLDQAKQIMDATIRPLCCQQIGGNHQRLHAVQTQHVGVTFKHVLLPVWLAAYHYRGRQFRMMINGQSGVAIGDRPYSGAKIALLVAIIVAIVLGAILLFRLLAQRRAGPRGQAPVRGQVVAMAPPSSTSTGGNSACSTPAGARAAGLRRSGRRAGPGRGCAPPAGRRRRGALTAGPRPPPPW